MADFDLSSATPAGSFDLSSAKPKSKSYDVINGKNVPTGSPEAHAAYSPTLENNANSFYGLPISQDAQNTIAGYGKAGYDLTRGVGQLTPFVSRQDVADSRFQDQPLMATRGGFVGNLAGNVLNTVPAALIPGANGVIGAGAIGLATGALQPSTSTGETIKNTVSGGLFGSGAILGGRALGAGYNAVKGLFSPLTESGQQLAAARTLQAFAGGGQDAANAASRLTNPPQLLSGIQPTTAELAGNAGISNLERSLANLPENVQPFATRTANNNQTIKSAIKGIAGTEAEQNAAEATRSAITAPMYRAASNATVTSTPELESILGRVPTSVWNRAQRLSQLNGATMELPQTLSPFAGVGGAAPQVTQYSGRTIQTLKQALADEANALPTSGIGKNETGAAKNLLNQLTDWTAQNVPKLAGADRVFAGASKPINQMGVGQKLADKLIPAIEEFGGDAGRNAASFASAVRGGDDVARGVTGWSGSTLENTLSPNQLQTVQLVGEQLAREAQKNAGRAAGSNTVQNLVGQDYLRQIYGPLGLPQSWAQSVFSKTLAKPLKILGDQAEPKISGLLSDAMLDPRLAQTLLTMPTSRVPKLYQALWNNQGLLAAPVSGIGRSLTNSPQ